MISYEGAGGGEEKARGREGVWEKESCEGCVLHTATRVVHDYTHTYMSVERMYLMVVWIDHQNMCVPID